MLTNWLAKATILGVLSTGMLVGQAAVGVGTPAAKADGCATGNVWFVTGWNVCDYGYFPDGSHTHCDTVFVFGIGGTNCFFVPGPPPPPLPPGPPPPPPPPL